MTDDHKLACYAGRDYGELYDLRTDPHHVRNLWTVPTRQELKQRLINRILTHEITKATPAIGPSDLRKLKARSNR